MEHRLHQSLNRRPLMLGVDKRLLMFELIPPVAAMSFAGIASWAFLASLVLTAGAVHPFLRWVHARDPDLPWILVNSVYLDSYYVPQARATDTRKPTQHVRSCITRTEAGATKQTAAQLAARANRRIEKWT